MGKEHNIAILPAGKFGTALAVPLSERAQRVTLYFRSPEFHQRFQATHENERAFPGIRLPENVSSTDNLQEAVEGADVLIIVPQARFFRSFYNSIHPHIRREVFMREGFVVLGSKGFEEETDMMMSEIVKQETPDLAKRTVTISGPNYAHEIVRGLPFATVLASENEAVADQLWEGVFKVKRRTKPYITDDVIGTELGGALKNVIAMAVGINDGMEMGRSAGAALRNRGLKEMIRLAVVLGADERTLGGLAGEADLALSCESPGRNYDTGREIGKYTDPEELRLYIKFLLDSKQTIEGLYSVKSAVSLARREKVIVPIMEILYSIIYEGLTPKEATEMLMEMNGKYEDPQPVIDRRLRFPFRLLNRALHIWHRAR